MSGPNTGIDPLFEAFYIETMLWHSTSAAESIDILDWWLDCIEKDDEEALTLSRSSLFYHLHNIIHQAGCLSRYFFPSRRNEIHARRATHLKAAFGVSEASPLADKDLRNAIEHFDERLDKYLAEPRVGHFIPELVDYESLETDVPSHVFKGFYIAKLEYELLGAKYDLASLVDEVQRIHVALNASASTGYRLPRS